MRTIKRRGRDHSSTTESVDSSEVNLSEEEVEELLEEMDIGRESDHE